MTTSPKSESSLNKEIDRVERPTWDEYFQEIAYKVSERSTCLRRKTGSLLVKDKRILTTGYNGSPSGLKHCADIGCLREEEEIDSGTRHELCRGLHAEQNAIIQAAMHGVKIADSTIYTTHHPCVLCAKMIINSGIVRVVYSLSYPDELSKEMLSEAKIIVERIELLQGI